MRLSWSWTAKSGTLLCPAPICKTRRTVRPFLCATLCVRTIRSLVCFYQHYRLGIELTGHLIISVDVSSSCFLRPSCDRISRQSTAESLQPIGYRSVFKRMRRITRYQGTILEEALAMCSHLENVDLRFHGRRKYDAVHQGICPHVMEFR